MINILKGKVIPVLRTKTKNDTIKSLDFLNKVSCDVVELTFSIPNIEKDYSEIKLLYPNINFIIGSVTNIELCQTAIQMGFRCLIAPNFDLEVCNLCRKYKVEYIPGCLTPSEIINAYNNNCELVKIFPFNYIDCNYLEGISKINPKIKFLVSGGVNKSNKSIVLNKFYAASIGGNYFENLDNKTLVDFEIFEVTNG